MVGKAQPEGKALGNTVNLRQADEEGIWGAAAVTCL